jgi:hypothetical protein
MKPSRTNILNGNITSLDREALERAIEITRSSGEFGRREQVDSMIKERGWFSAATFSASCAQSRSICPKLWQPVPMDITDVEGAIARGDDGAGGKYAAARLLRKMLRAGLSRYEPRPLEALGAAAA